MALEKVTMTSSMAENEVKEEDSKDSLTLSESKVIQVNKINQKQLEISIEMKSTYQNSSAAKLVSEAIALSVPGLRPASQLAPMTGHGLLGGGVLVVPQSIRPPYSVNPWQSSAWFPQVTHLQNYFCHPNVAAFNQDAVYVTQKPEKPVITVMTAAPLRIAGSHSFLQPEIGITSFSDDMTFGPTKLTRNEPMQRSTQRGAESELFASKNLDNYSAHGRLSNQKEVKSHHRPGLTRTAVSSSGALCCGGVLEQLDPVSRAVYCNFLGCFSKKTPARSSQGHRR